MGHLEDDLDYGLKRQRGLDVILAEYDRARRKHPPLRNNHEGYAVILEELEEFWDAVKADDHAQARKEIIQVGAMALAIILEVK